MSRRSQQQAMDTSPPGVAGDEVISGSGELEADEVMMEEVEQEGYRHDYFCEVAEDFIEDDFNLTGLNAMVPFWKEAMEMVLDVEPDEDSAKIPDVSIVEASAELLYGLVHQRYILTRSGLQAMAEKYEQGVFGACPRVYCMGCNVVPCGRTDLPGQDTVKLYCPNCNDIYVPPSSRFQGVDGAFFGTTFAHLFFQSYRELLPAPFWKPHASSRSLSPAQSPRSGVGSVSSQDAPFVNPNTYGGQKRAAGRVYSAKIYGFRVSEKAKSGPRMQWMRLRPESPEELDYVDWRGRWIDDEDDLYDEDEDAEAEEDRQMEDFDPEHAGGEAEEEEEEEEEEDAHDTSRTGRHHGFQLAPETTHASSTGTSEKATSTSFSMSSLPLFNMGSKVKAIRQLSGSHAHVVAV